jgi:AraC-like DNA-binding protein
MYDVKRAQPTVVTILEPDDRPRLDAAANGCFATVHANSVPEVIRAVRERPVHAVLVSPAYLPPDHIPNIASLVRGFPGVATVAVISRHDTRASQRLLELGASGIRSVVDLTSRGGWNELRELVGHPASPTSARILAAAIPAMGRPNEDCLLFFQTMIRLAPDTTTVRALARFFGIQPSTFMSRFFRAGLPSPKHYLATTRILFASALLEEQGLSIADIAYRLQYSSPQSFGRHVRALVEMTAGEFRRRVPFETALGDYCKLLIVPFRATFRRFHPLKNHGVATFGHSGLRSSGVD